LRNHDWQIGIVSGIDGGYLQGDRSMNMDEFYEKYPVQTMLLSTNKKGAFDLIRG
jgi:hypothetical protein